MKKLKKALDLTKSVQRTPNCRNFHVSIIFDKKKVLAIGVNNKKTHPRNLKNPKATPEGVDVSREKYSCSELNAFIKLKNKSNIKFSKCTLLNVRLLRDGSFGNAKPCQSCESLIRYLGFKEVYFTNENGEIVKYNEPN